MNGSPDLSLLREEGWNSLYPDDAVRIAVGMGTCGKAAGAQDVYERLQALANEGRLAADVRAVGCNGLCFAEPIAEVLVPGFPRAVYHQVDAAWCDALASLLAQGLLPTRNLLGVVRRDWMEGFGSWVDLSDEPEPPLERTSSATAALNLARHPFLAGQTKRLTAAWGRIVPWSVREYAACGGYDALERVVRSLGPSAVLDMIDEARLRGRGGAGFPAGRKWRAVAEADRSEKYVVANADEGDPGAYMDRTLMESDPHRIIEGMAIAAHAIGARKGFVFTRSEYPGAVAALEAAIAEAERAGLTGPSAFNAAAPFELRVVKSAGAYVCGEETALLAALEGRRPDPAPRPPYPSERGLLGRPTLVGNVETFANVPSIAAHGPQRFRSVGTSTSPGTKVFSLAGAVERAGLVEVPLGTPADTVVRDMAGLALGDARFAGGGTTNGPEGESSEDPAASRVAVQIGGPSGAILPLDLKRLALDFESLAAAGGILGSGGIVVLGPRTCVADTVRYFLDFSARASCGRCPSCRDGLAEAKALMESVCAGRGDPSTLERLEALARRIPKGSRCGLGKMAATPLSSALSHFRNVLEDHLRGRCEGLTCKDLMHFEVAADACPGCLCCLPSCPVGAIKGRFGRPFNIDQVKCTKCWMCVAQCPYPALRALPVPAAQADASTPHAALDPGSASASHSKASPAPIPDGADAARTRPVACTLCGRCVEACSSAGASALCFLGTGITRHVAKPLHRGFSPCTGCNACERICPTGAIRDAPAVEMGRP